MFELFANGKSYTVAQIAGKIGCRQKRAALDWLDKMQVPGVIGPKHTEVFLGDHLNQAILEQAQWPLETPKSDG